MIRGRDFEHSFDLIQQVTHLCVKVDSLTESERERLTTQSYGPMGFAARVHLISDLTVSEPAQDLMTRPVNDSWGFGKRG
jgi:hypothetical protein